MPEKDHNSNRTNPTFTMCCIGGKIHLSPLLQPPSYLMHLYTSSGSDTNSFRSNIRAYNTALACISFGANIDQFHNQGISNFRIHGQIYHRIRSLLLEEHHSPKFAQLYVYDTDHENTNRQNIV